MSRWAIPISKARVFKPGVHELLKASQKGFKRIIFPSRRTHTGFGITICTSFYIGHISYKVIHRFHNMF